MTITELQNLENDHADLVKAILACAKVGSGRIALELPSDELGRLARTLVMVADRKQSKCYGPYDLYELELTYLELDINLYSKVAIR